VAAIESLLKRVENIEAPTDLITTRIAPAMDAIKEAGEAINKRASGDGKVLARLTTAIENALASSSLLEQNVSALNAVAVQAQENMLTLNKSADMGNSVLSSISQTVVEAQKLTQEHVKSLHEVKQSLGGTSTAMSSLIASWQSEADAAIALISQKGSEAKNNIQQSINDLKGQEIRTIQELASSAETILETVRKHSTELDKELEKIAKTLKKNKSSYDEVVESYLQKYKGLDLVWTPRLC
jgi:chromosome segregation ATPase